MSVPHNVDIYLDGENGDDTNPGTKELPVKTRQRAHDLLPREFTGYCNLHSARAEDLLLSKEELAEAEFRRKVLLARAQQERPDLFPKDGE